MPCKKAGCDQPFKGTCTICKASLVRAWVKAHGYLCSDCLTAAGPDRTEDGLLAKPGKTLWLRMIENAGSTDAITHIGLACGMIAPRALPHTLKEFSGLYTLWIYLFSNGFSCNEESWMYELADGYAALQRGPYTTAAGAVGECLSAFTEAGVTGEVEEMLQRYYDLRGERAAVLQTKLADLSERYDSMLYTTGGNEVYQCLTDMLPLIETEVRSMP